MYQKVLTLCNEEPALREGGFFDLMYVNLRHEGFNPHRHFAFLRYTDESVLLIVVNFDNVEADVNVVIPRLAFEMAGLHESDVVADDILCGRSVFVRLVPDQGSSVHLNPKDAVVLRIK